MPVINKVLPNSYYDSVFLMRIAQKITLEDGVEEAAAMMGTPANKEILERARILADDGQAAGPNDLVIAVKGTGEEHIAAALQRLDELLSGQEEDTNGEDTNGEDTSGEEFNPRSLSTAMERLPRANLLLLSIPGAYVKRETLKALREGLHVMIFSDNVPLEDEIALKKEAAKVRRLVMGPDCGTVLIGGKALGFGNVVREGNIGIVAASGTGIQEVATLIHKLGFGVTHAIGVGGKDLSKEVGAISFLAGLNCLAEDAATETVVMISKPPAPEVAETVLAAATQIAKPVIVCFLGSREKQVDRENLRFVTTLEDAAREAALSAARTGSDTTAKEAPASRLETGLPHQGGTLPPIKPLGHGQRYIRALFSGGTLCEEALNVLEHVLIGDITTNLKPRGSVQTMPDPFTSTGHAFVDLGEDLFTRGRPHPMIDFDLRCKRIVQEAEDPGTAVILLDVVLGYGSHDDPAGELIPAITEARRQAEKRSVSIDFVASICGTDEDPQEAKRQKQELEKAGVLMTDCNAAAARLAARILEARATVAAARASAAETSGEEIAEAVDTHGPAESEPTGQTKAAGQNVAAPEVLPVDMGIFRDGLGTINMGLKSFCDSLRDQQSPAVHVDWRPPARGDRELTALLDRLL